MAPDLKITNRLIKEICVLHLSKISKYWLLGSICVIFINLIFFIFRNYVDEIVLLWVVILTPVVCLILYPLACLLDRNRNVRSGKRT
jgi:hypothetical protein